MFNRKEYISVKEAAEALGYFAPYINKLIRDGKIKAVKRGRGYFIHINEIDRVAGMPEPKEVVDLI